MTGFLGPNGAGKTTTMRMITGLVPATAGSALVDGRPYAARAQPGRGHGHAAGRRRRAPGPHRADAPAAAGRRLGVPGSRVDEVLDLVGLTDAGRTADPRLLARHAAAAGHRRRAAGRPAGADVRRAGQRAGPRGHPLDARAAPRPRGPRRHGAAVLAPARRGRAHGRPAAGDRRRADRRRRAGGLAAGNRRRLRARRRTGRAGGGPAGPRVRRLPGDDGALVVSGASPGDVGAVAAAGGHVLSELRPLQRGLEDVFFSLTAA